MSGWKREGLSLVVGLVCFVVTVFAAMLLIALRQDIPPEGPSCIHRVQYASGGSGAVGVEQIRWSLLPDRICVVDGWGPGGGAKVIDFVVAGLAGVLAAGFAAATTDRRLRSRDKL